MYAAVAQTPQPYDIKGERLGMSFEEFKKNHYNFRAGNPQKHIKDAFSPHCVTGKSDVFLMLSVEEAAIGITACYPGIDPLDELILHKHPGPTLANQKLQAYTFYFYKGKLFKIIAVFKADEYDAMKAAFIEKFGKTFLERSNSIIWSNGISTVGLTHYASGDNSIMLMTLKSVMDEINSILPKPKNDL